MRGIRIVVLSLGLWLTTLPSASAGIYNTEQPFQYQSAQEMKLGQFFLAWNYYVELFRPPDQPQAPQRAEFDRRIKELEEKNQAFELTVDERVSLSAYYLRLQQPEKATRVLTPVEGQRHFMVLSNLATAHHLAGRIDRALDCLERALQCWPNEWPGLSRLQLSWFYRAEMYYQVLLQHRNVADRAARGGPVAMKLDPLFPKVQYVGATGQYQAGEISPSQYARLPPDHMLLIEQMLLWLPLDDGRLRWQFAELLNANGDVTGAADIMARLVWQGVPAPEMRAHLKVLREANPQVVRWRSDMIETKEYQRLQWMLTPRFPGMSPVVGPLANEIGWGACLEKIRRLELKADQEAEAAATISQESALTRPEPASKRLELRPVVVGFLAGVVVTVLASMQFRELRRRRQDAPAAVSKS